MPNERWIALIDDLRKRGSEQGWFEFKRNNANPEMLGRTISALANGARYHDQPSAYLIWGIDNATGEICGSDFDLHKERHKQQPLELWLSQMLDPMPDLQFISVPEAEHRVAILKIAPPSSAPVKFDRQAWIRVGEAVTLLSDHAEKERTLWERLRSFAWEQGIAAEFLSVQDVLKLLDHSAYFDLLGIQPPNSDERLLEILAADRLVTRDVGDRWNITNVGGVLFANRLADFHGLARRPVRVIEHTGTNRVGASRKEYIEPRGYAAAFSQLNAHILSKVPTNEHIKNALRQDVPLYPPISIREILANALIHQDMTISGTGPVVEIFADRIEVSNPGAPLVELSRLIDFPPRSRNEMMAALMRRVGICEERGRGIDRVIDAAEVFQLPAPLFRVDGQNMSATLYAPRQFSTMSNAERVRACYQHAALRYVGGDVMVNASLRQRLGVETRNAAQISRIIKEALSAGVIRAADPNSPRGGYVPYWAGQGT